MFYLYKIYIIGIIFTESFLSVLMFLKHEVISLDYDFQK